MYTTHNQTAAFPSSSSHYPPIVRRHAIQRRANRQQEQHDDDVQHQAVARRTTRHGVEDPACVAREAFHFPYLGGTPFEGVALLAQGRVDLAR